MKRWNLLSNFCDSLCIHFLSLCLSVSLSVYHLLIILLHFVLIRRAVAALFTIPGHRHCRRRACGGRGRLDGAQQQPPRRLGR